MSTLSYSLYDCFARENFQGHVAAIVEVDKDPELSFATKIALELCQTVTCFAWIENGCLWVKSIAKNGSVWSINHGLLAVARHFSCDKIHTLDGVYGAEVNNDNVIITLPNIPLTDTEMPERLNQAFDIMPISVSDVGKTCVVELRSVEDLVNLELDINRVAKLDYDGLVLTAEDDGVSFDYVCRYFSPKHYINENSGSLYIQAFLPLFWQERLNKNSLSFLHHSQRRSVGRSYVREYQVDVEAMVKHTFRGVLKVS